MIPMSEVRAVDALAARLLLGWSRGEVAAAADLTERTVLNLETGKRVRQDTRETVLRALAAAGARFMGKGDVRHVDGRQAPMREAVGSIRGERLRLARKRLGLGLHDVAAAARLNTSVLMAMEASPNDLTQRPTAGFYRVVGALQLAGYAFAPWQHGGVRGDRVLVEPQRRARARKDRSRYHTKGMRVPGLRPGVEEPVGED